MSFLEVPEFKSFLDSDKLSLELLYRHILISGETGSGKTKSILYPLLKAIYHYLNRGEKISCFVIDFKQAELLSFFEELDKEKRYHLNIFDIKEKIPLFAIEELSLDQKINFIWSLVSPYISTQDKYWEFRTKLLFSNFIKLDAILREDKKISLWEKIFIFEYFKYFKNTFFFVFKKARLEDLIKFLEKFEKKYFQLQEELKNLENFLKNIVDIVETVKKEESGKEKTNIDMEEILFDSLDSDEDFEFEIDDIFSSSMYDDKEVRYKNFSKEEIQSREWVLENLCALATIKKNKSKKEITFYITPYSFLKILFHFYFVSLEDLKDSNNVSFVNNNFVFFKDLIKKVKSLLSKDEKIDNVVEDILNSLKNNKDIKDSIYKNLSSFLLEYYEKNFDNKIDKENLIVDIAFICDHRQLDLYFSSIWKKFLKRIPYFVLFEIYTTSLLEYSKDYEDWESTDNRWISYLIEDKDIRLGYLLNISTSDRDKISDIFRLIGYDITNLKILFDMINQKFCLDIFDLSPFVDSEENPLEKYILDGKVIFLSVTKGGVGDLKQFEVVGKLLKYAFIRTAFTLYTKGKRNFPFLYIADEFQRFITSDGISGEQTFLDVARAYKFGAIFATQSYQALYDALSRFEISGKETSVDVLLQIIATKIFFRSTDPKITAYLLDAYPSCPAVFDYPHIIKVRPPSTLEVGEMYYLLPKVEGIKKNYGRAKISLKNKY